MPQRFIQMSGVPGSGKSTVARAIAREIPAVIIDHDITKSALLAAGVPVETAGKASYEVLGALAEHLLSQGHSVIFDSPCLYSNLLNRGQRQAREAGAAYYYIECFVDDVAELDRRLRSRDRLPSQIPGVNLPGNPGSGKAHLDEAVFREWMGGMKRPASGYLSLDTTRPLAECAAAAIAYILGDTV